MLIIRSMSEGVKSTPANDWSRELKEKMNVAHRIVREHNRSNVAVGGKFIGKF